jgi:hypothetical protein
VHADLFRDNALFDGPPDAPRLSGVFDFYFAGVDHHVYDLAVCVNDWCVDLDTGRLEPEHAEALLRAYHLHRPMSPAELRALPGMRRAAALRFWLSRLADWHLPREAALLKPKDPTHFERVLVDCIDNPWHPSSDMTPSRTPRRRDDRGPTVRHPQHPRAAGLRWIRLGFRAFGASPLRLHGHVRHVPAGDAAAVARGAADAAGRRTSIRWSAAEPRADAAAVAGVHAGHRGVTNDLRMRPSVFFAPLRGAARRGARCWSIGMLALRRVFGLAWYARQRPRRRRDERWFNAKLMPPRTDGKMPELRPPLSDAARLVLLP